jgi:hypothetical protein
MVDGSQGYMTSSKQKNKFRWLQEICHSPDRINMDILVVNLTDKDLDILKKKGGRERDMHRRAILLWHNGMHCWP